VLQSGSRLVDDVPMSRVASVRQVGVVALIGLAAACMAMAALLHGHGGHHASSSAPPTTPGEPRTAISVYLRGAAVTPGQVPTKADQTLLPFPGDVSRAYEVNRTPIAALSASYAWVQRAGFRSTWEIQLYAPGFTNATVNGQQFVTTHRGRAIEGFPVYASGPRGPNVAFDGIGSQAAAVTLARSWTSQVTVLH
jgi:hypothetical protein